MIYVLKDLWWLIKCLWRFMVILMIYLPSSDPVAKTLLFNLKLLLILMIKRSLGKSIMKLQNHLHLWNLIYKWIYAKHKTYICICFICWEIACSFLWYVFWHRVSSCNIQPSVGSHITHSDWCFIFTKHPLSPSPSPMSHLRSHISQDNVESAEGLKGYV